MAPIPEDFDSYITMMTYWWVIKEYFYAHHQSSKMYIECHIDRQLQMSVTATSIAETLL